MYDGVLRSHGGHRGEIRLRGSEGKPNPSPSQKHPKADYLLQWVRTGAGGGEGGVESSEREGECEQLAWMKSWHSPLT